MLSAVLLWNLLCWVAPPTPPVADGPKVTAAEILDVRHVRLKGKDAQSGRHFSFQEPGLKLVLEVQGADVVRASQYGMLEVAAAADDKGGKLKLNDEALGFHDLRKELVAIDREQMFMGEDKPPKDVIRVELPFESPARAATSISVRGKLQLKRVETVDVVVPAKVGDVQHEQLAKLGVTLKIVKAEQDNGFAYEVSGKLDVLNDAQVLDAAGQPLEKNGSSSMSDGETLHREIMLAQPLPADAKLKLALVVKAENVPVTFDLKDLKLP